MLNDQKNVICNVCNLHKCKVSYKHNIIKLCLKCEKHYEKASRQQIELIL